MSRLSFRLLLGLAAVFLLAGFTMPQAPLGRVSDFSKTLKPNAVSGLENRFAKLERESGHQVAVAVFSSIDDEAIDDLANRLFEKWRVGANERNDGILLVLALKEHKARIEVGYGLEGVVPDAVASRIIREDLAPHLKEGQLATALVAFALRLERIFAIKGDPRTEPAYSELSTLNPWALVLLPLLFAIFMVVVFYLRHRFGNYTIYSGGRSRRSTWSGWPHGGGGGWGGFGGGGGGGGWSGGGGLSGGGGASGNW